MTRLVLLSFGAVLFFASDAQAHERHRGCAIGDTWMGVVSHFHPGGGRASECGTGKHGGTGRHDPKNATPQHLKPAPPPPPPELMRAR